MLLLKVNPFEIQPSSALSFFVSHLCIFPFIKQERRCEALPRELLPRVFSLSLSFDGDCVGATLRELRVVFASDKLDR